MLTFPHGTVPGLIINADDCNLTRGVTQAILECHERGVVSSTTWLTNLETDSRAVDQVQKSGLGVGVHLNVTLGKPVSSLSWVTSLVDEFGIFKKKTAYQSVPPRAEDLVYEYQNQITLFEKHFGQAPTHLDTHHQLHDEPVFMQALAHVARQHRLPIRRSRLMAATDFAERYSGMTTTQSLLGDLSASEFWTLESFEKALADLSLGVTELMCHPGIIDDDLKKISSMIIAREKEYQLFSSPRLKNLLDQHKIRLIHFKQL